MVTTIQAGLQLFIDESNFILKHLMAKIFNG